MIVDRYLRRSRYGFYSVVSAGSGQDCQPKFAARSHRPEPWHNAEPDLARLATAALPRYAAIPGTSSIAHLEENLAAASIRLTSDEFHTIASL
jgi:hypothetical protein